MLDLFPMMPSYAQLVPGNAFLKELNEGIDGHHIPKDLVVDVTYGTGTIGENDGVVSHASTRLSPENDQADLRNLNEHNLAGYWHIALPVLGWAGVANVQTDPPELHPGYRVMKSFALDLDNDGVSDNGDVSVTEDSCPGTPATAAVNRIGCAFVQSVPRLIRPAADEVVDANDVRLQWEPVTQPDERMDTDARRVTYCYEINDADGVHAAHVCNNEQPIGVWGVGGPSP